MAWVAQEVYHFIKRKSYFTNFILEVFPISLNFHNDPASNFDHHGSRKAKPPIRWWEKEEYKIYDLYELSLKGIQSHWESKLILNSCDIDAYDWTRRAKPWFGDLQLWLSEVRSLCSEERPCYADREKLSSNSAKIFMYPLSVYFYDAMMPLELDTILPQTSSYVKAFLPVLLFSYIVNRRGSPKDKLDQNGYPKIPSSELSYTASYYHRLVTRPKDLTQQERSKMLNDGRKLFLAKHWETIYPKLTFSSLQQNELTTRKIYGRILLFLRLILKTNKICNITLSMYAFEYMTGLLSLVCANLPVKHIRFPQPICYDNDPLRKDFLNFIKDANFVFHPHTELKKYVIYLKFQYLLREQLVCREHDGAIPDEFKKKIIEGLEEIYTLVWAEKISPFYLNEQH